MASKTKPTKKNPKISTTSDSPEKLVDEVDDSAASNDPPPESEEIAPPEGQDSNSGTEEKSEKLGRILSIKVPVIVKIAQKKMSLSEILKLRNGTVIQFDQDAYQHVELMVNNSTIGLGQPVKLGENFGLKVSQIGEITQTIKALKKRN